MNKTRRKALKNKRERERGGGYGRGSLRSRDQWAVRQVEDPAPVRLWRLLGSTPRPSSHDDCSWANETAQAYATWTCVSLLCTRLYNSLLYWHRIAHCVQAQERRDQNGRHHSTNRKKEKPPGSLFVHVRCNLIYLISRMLHVFQEAVYLVDIQSNISIQKIRKNNVDRAFSWRNQVITEFSILKLNKIVENIHFKIGFKH